MVFLSAQFSQLVWKKTKILGIAFAEYEPSDAKGFVKTVIVANYFPCGNVQQKFLENVLPPPASRDIDESSKLQRHLDKYKRKKARQAKTYSIISGRKIVKHGNLGM